MAKRKKKKAAVGETALPKGVPFDRQRESPLKWGIAIFKGALLVAPIAVGAVCASCHRHSRRVCAVRQYLCSA